MTDYEQLWRALRRHYEEMYASGQPLSERHAALLLMPFEERLQMEMQLALDWMQLALDWIPLGLESSQHAADFGVRTTG